MCLMSNPEYQFEKHMLVPVMEDLDVYAKEDIILVEKKAYVHRYVALAYEAAASNALGVVI